MIEIRLLNTIEEIRLCEDIQKQAWGMDEDGVVPAPHMNAVNYSGGMIAGGFVGPELVGFIYGFLAKHDHEEKQGFGLHSHMMAVIPSYQGQGLGKQLKWFQRDWCLAQGLNWVTWTYDPMQAPNARLNLEHFAAYANHYKVNIYGEMDDALNRGMPTDRLLAWWPLQDDSVRALKDNGKRLTPNHELNDVPFALQKTKEGFHKDLNLNTPVVQLQIPINLLSLIKQDAALALEWRLHARDVFLHYFEQGYTAKRFLGESYLLYKA